MTESSFYHRLTLHYAAQAIARRRSIVWEAKFTRSNRIRFDALDTHQEIALLESETSHGYKIRDAGVFKKPYDGYAIYNALALVVLIYNTEVFEMPIRTFIEEKYTSKEKSLTRERCLSLGTLVSL